MGIEGCYICDHFVSFSRISSPCSVAKENVSRFATHQGYQVQATEQGDDILLKLTK